MLTLLLLTAVPDVGSLVIDSSSDSCLSESAVKAEVRARLGRDGLVAEAPRQFVVSETSRAPHAATLTIREPGTPDAVRTFTSAGCNEVLESLALAIAVALDPAVLLVVPKRPPPVKKQPPPPEVVPAEPPPPLHVHAGLLAGLSLGLAPGPTATVGVVTSVSWRSFELRADGRFELPREIATSSNQVSAFSAIGTLAPGWQRRWLRVGLPVSVGALFFTSTQNLETFRGTRVVVLVGPEVGFRWRPLPWLAVEPFVRAQFVPTRVSVLSGAQTLWVTWPVSVLVGLQLLGGTGETARE